MSETQEQWNNRQAIELLAQHIPFERDTASKAEQIEMLRGLVIRHGRNMDPDLFGFEARNELIRLGLWDRIGPEEPEERVQAFNKSSKINKREYSACPLLLLVWRHL